jgi:hypothetical protein
MNLIDLRPLGSVCGLERDARQHERYRRNPCSRPGGAVASMSSVGMSCRTRFFGTVQDRVDDLPASNQRYSRGGMIRMHALRPGERVHPVCCFTEPELEAVWEPKRRMS